MGEGDGPREFHLVLLDNGRTNVLADQVGRQTLRCIRCSACLNVCPVYERVGGHAYESVYPGPIGAILTPQLRGLDEAGSLPYASSLCGACYEVCPVAIDIPSVLVHLRRRVVEETEKPRDPEHAAMRALGWAFSSPVRFALAQRLARAGNGPLARLPGPLSGWTQSRDLPTVPHESFRQWWRKRGAGDLRARGGAGPRAGGAGRRAAGRGAAAGARLRARGGRRARGGPLRRAGGGLPRDGAPRGGAGRGRGGGRGVRGAGARRLVVPSDLPPAWRPDGLELRADEGLSHGELDSADGALTGCALAIAETGTIVLDAGPGQGRRALTLIPDFHVCVVEAQRIVASVPEAVAALHEAAREGRPITLVSGPSATSDIELRRVHGVHGPRTLTVLIAEAG